ncbi:hypothetical protein [Neoaquamicrobium sediminum]|uniref:hypothetical protein n=1 Tax=Neoaquamicrobium sediminum TaxID=1849104 RepID=UPI003BA9AF87
MLQFLFNVASRVLHRCDLSETEQWRMDPLAHPALRGMSQAELGDLPIGHAQLPRRLVEGGC